MSADTAAAQKLRAFLERIERLEEGRKSLADDIADVYKELTGEGFDKDAAKVVLKIRKTDDGLAKWNGASETVDIYLSALGMLPEIELSRAPARVRENIEQFPAHDAETGEVFEPTQEQPVETDTALNNGEDHEPDSGQRIGRQDGKQRSATPVSSFVGRGEIADDGDQGQGAGASGTDRSVGPVSGELDCQDEDGRSRHVGGEVDHEITIPHSPASQALQADKTSEAVTPPTASLAPPEGTKLANADCGSDPLHDAPSAATGQAGAVTSLEDAAAPATVSDDDVPAFLKKDKQPNPDCQKPGNCKWDHSQISCSACQQAADQRRARAA